MGMGVGQEDLPAGTMSVPFISTIAAQHGHSAIIPPLLPPPHTHLVSGCMERDRELGLPSGQERSDLGDEADLHQEAVRSRAHHGVVEQPMDGGYGSG